jgi:CDP-4-dehydro-6-deoxyglucose reductase, E1
MSFNYPLLENAFSAQDISFAIKVVKSKKLTMSKKTTEFEKNFSKFIKSKYCLMVNSGSSANLLAFFTLINPIKKNKLKLGDECLIPALCWSTSLWPIIQSGLKPKFIDVDLKTFSPNLETIKKNITKKTKAIMLINVLGNCSEIDKIKSFAKKKNIYLIEDNCESLGSIYKKKNLGTYGDFSTFSFYYSHQLTAGEGGMIVCNNKADYNILRSLRAHGWDREISKKKNTFNFINQGFNLRPLDVSAAIAISQLKRLKQMIKIRKYNRDMIINFLKKSPKWNNQFTFFESSKFLKPSWFSIPLLINQKYLKNKKIFLKNLEKKKIETRPIISGNFINQPAIKLHKLKFNKNNFKNSQEIEDRGFFIGLPTKKIKIIDLKKLADCLLDLK